MMKGNIAGLMKQAQQMQENMKRAQAELEAKPALQLGVHDPANAIHCDMHQT